MQFLSKGQAGDKWETFKQSSAFFGGTGMGEKFFLPSLEGFNHPCKNLMPKILPSPKYVLYKTGHNYMITNHHPTMRSYFDFLLAVGSTALFSGWKLG
jgi:hypothetical protein